jgi:tetratricopeptide (TPR) repeat protein
VKPDAADYRSLLATTCGLLGQLRLALGDHAAARQLHDRACEVLERLVETNPAVGRFQEQLASAIGQLGLLLHELGDYDGALACFDRGHAIREPLVKANPQDAVLHSSISANAHNKGRTLANSGRYADALPAFQLAAEHQRIAFGRAPEVTRYRLNLSNHLKGVAQASREVGRLVESAAAARERQSLWPDQPEELYAVAKEMCDCVVRVGKNKNDLTAEEQAERDQYAQWAVAALRQAVACGFRDVERLMSDPSLETLRSRPDFRDLLKSLAIKRQSP